MEKNKTAIVTGGSRGIGRAIAIRLAQCGMNIAIIYSGNDDAANDTISELSAFGVAAMAYRCDVSNFNQSRDIVTQIAEEFGGVDVLVNNAGIVRDGLVLSMKSSDFTDVIDINLTGAFNMIKHTYPIFVRRRKGRIINIASVSGICGNPGQANYSASKAGMIGLTKSVAKELASRSITCNAIAPGFIQTDMTDELSDKVKETAISQIPMKRMGTAIEVANLATFLAGDLSAYITGEVIKVDGGLCM